MIYHISTVAVILCLRSWSLNLEKYGILLWEHWHPNWHDSQVLPSFLTSRVAGNPAHLQEDFQLCCDNQPTGNLIFNTPLPHPWGRMSIQQDGCVFSLELCNKAWFYYSSSCRNADSLLQLWSRGNTPAHKWVKRCDTDFYTLQLMCFVFERLNTAAGKSIILIIVIWGGINLLCICLSVSSTALKVWLPWSLTWRHCNQTLSFEVINEQAFHFGIVSKEQQSADRNEIPLLI